MKIFVTGATGFIGRFLVEELFRRGYSDITALARKTSDISFLKKLGAKIVVGDITDESSLNSAGVGYDAVFHCAASINNYDRKALRRANVSGTENVFRWAAGHKIKKMIYVSSVSVNSVNTDVPLSEELPYGVTSSYGASKLEAEKIAVRFRDSGLPTVIVRPAIVYGEGEPHWMPLLGRFMRLRFCFLPACGSSLLHMVSVRNVADCLVSCFEDDRALGKIFNIADSRALTIRQLLGIMAGCLGVPVPALLPRPIAEKALKLPFADKCMGHLLKDRVYSTERLKEEIGFIPKYDVTMEFALAALFLRAKKYK
ncbi:MAG: NAD-dependent epimerase/dehydratase family protein [Candidatus Omnitrophica bacterium]|nr:NAD-dependent epimerase/dehydratase family protein [Candidatus Omnitrophota bacterium]MDD5771319.1 NAD-dependent epimerase/dehydratase family protein [Candidatus Omnitrophota bacterium]